MCQDKFIAHDTYSEHIHRPGLPCLVKVTYKPCETCDPGQAQPAETTKGDCLYYQGRDCMYKTNE